MGSSPPACHLAWPSPAPRSAPRRPAGGSRDPRPRPPGSGRRPGWDVPGRLTDRLGLGMGRPGRWPMVGGRAGLARLAGPSPEMASREAEGVGQGGRSSPRRDRCRTFRRIGTGTGLGLREACGRRGRASIPSPDLTTSALPRQNPHAESRRHKLPARDTCPAFLPSPDAEGRTRPALHSQVWRFNSPPDSSRADRQKETSPVRHARFIRSHRMPDRTANYAESNHRGRRQMVGSGAEKWYPPRLRRRGVEDARAFEMELATADVA